MNPTRSWLSRLRFQFSLQTALVVALLWSAGLGTWAYFRQVREKGEPVLVLRDEYVGVIFPRKTPVWDTPTEWEPSIRDVERAERRIPEFLRSEAPHLASRLDEYVRQYFGIVVGGRRVVLCSFIHRTAESTEVPIYGIDYYLRGMGRPYLVIDGGEHFFQLLYDAETDCCSSLHVNAAS